MTKRAERLPELNLALPWTPNIWMGVSVENRRFVHRIDHLRQTGAHVKFLSLEPLLGPLDDQVRQVLRLVERYNLRLEDES